MKKVIEKQTNKTYDVCGVMVMENGRPKYLPIEEIDVLDESPVLDIFSKYSAGTILACDESDGCIWVFEYDGVRDDEVYAYRNICYNRIDGHIDWKTLTHNALMDVKDVKNLRLATEKECEMLNNATSQPTR